MKGIIRQLSIIFFTLGTLVVNYLANAIPLGGMNTGQVADQYKIFFFPQSYVFSIWGLIYAFLIVFTIYQALPSQRESKVFNSIAWPYILSCMANMVWIFMWHFNHVTLSVAVMFIILASLIWIYAKLGIGFNKLKGANYWFLNITFSIYLGWISVASVANISGWLYSRDWNGFGLAPEIWTIIMLVVVFLLTGVMLFTRRDWAYGIVIIWALVGIAMRYPENKVVFIASLVTAGLVTIDIIIALVINNRKSMLQVK